MGWLTGWGIRYAVTVTENSGSTLSDHQVGEVGLQGVNSASANFIDFTKFKTDGSDLRITKSDGLTTESHWVRNWNVLSKTALLYFKASALTASSNNTFYLYGSNSAASTISSYSGTMTKYPSDDPNLIALYHCDSLTAGNQLIDSGPNAFNTYSNSIGLFGSDGGKFNGEDYTLDGDCLNFPDTGSPFIFGPNALIAHDNAWNALTTAGTIMLWTKHDVVNRSDAIFIKADTGFDDKYAMFRVDKLANSFFRGVLADGTNTEIALSTTNPSSGVWYFITFGWDSSTAQLYVNNVLEDENARSITISTNSKDIGIGVNPGFPSGGPTNWFFHQGQLDEIVVLDYLVNSAEVDAAYHRRKFASTQPTWVFGAEEEMGAISSFISKILSGIREPVQYGIR